jgi:Predicted Zn-dependent peptidases
MEKKLTASNGINIYYYKQPNTHSICISLYIKTGTLYESEHPGITHFLEHLHFRKLGGRTQKDLYYQLECIGGHMGASTYKEFLQFYLTASPKYFKNLAKIASDLLGELEADIKDFYAEKRLVLSEIREDNQNNDVNFFSNKYIWKNTNLQNPVLGSISSVKAFTLQMLKDEKEKAFTRRNMFFYVTGNFSDADIDGLAREIERYSLNDRLGTQKNNIAEIPDGFMDRNAFVKIINRKYFMHNLKISFDVDFNMASRRELFFLDSILAGGLCSLIRAEIIEKKGFIYSFTTTVDEYANIGVYCFELEVYKSKLLDTVKSFISVLKEVKKTISEKDMLATIVFKTDNQMLFLDDPEGLNWQMAYLNHIMDNNFSDISELADSYRNIQKEQLVKIANDIFSADNTVLVSIGNKKGLSENKLHEILLEL